MRIPTRYKITALLTAASSVNYLDRVNIAVAAPVIMAATDWREEDFGLIFSAFLLGYSLIQFPAGMLVDRYNGWKILAFSCIGFSLMTALTPMGGSAFALMLVIRFMVGAFESATFPAFTSINSRWIPRSEFGFAHMLSVSGMYLGQVVAYPVTTWIISGFSWQAVFYFNAALGFIWLIFWYLFGKNDPSEDKKISAGELAYIRSNRAVQHSGTKTAQWRVIQEKQVLLLCAAYIGLAIVAWIVIFWLPTYLVKARGLSLKEMGIMGMFPVITSFLGMTLGGAFSDFLLKKGFSLRIARVRGPMFCLAVGIPFLVTAVLTPSTITSITCIAIFMFLKNISTVCFYATALEYDPKYVGSVTGLMSSLGNSAGMIGPLVVGFLVSSTGSWVIPFLTAAALATMTFLIAFFLVKPDPIEFKGIPTEHFHLKR